MSSVHRFNFAASCVALALCACGSDDGDSKQPAPDLSISWKETVLDESSQVVEGMKVCAHGRADIPCATTDALGIFEIALPRGEELIFSYEKDAFVTKYRPMPALETSSTFAVWFIQRKQWYDDAAAVFGGILDYSQGMIGAQSLGVAGLTFELSPNDGTAPGYAEDVTFEFNSLLTETSVLGVGAFMNVPPGPHEVHFVHKTKTCAAKGWAGKDATWMKAEAFAGALTHVTMPCE